MHRPLKFQHGNHIYSQYMTNTIFFTDDGLFLKFNITNYNCKIWAQYCTKLSELHKEPYGLNGIILHSCPYELANIYGYFGASLCFSSPEKLNFKSFSSLSLRSWILSSSNHMIRLQEGSNIADRSARTLRSDICTVMN